ncbi:unnamed protein product [Paramecium octaurelia]|uniref:Poly(A) RNA polymerase mitochondrial-like central palm domain-containing protein n=1 Tax=Paramecium octaurelia TaxID=43137 RepID=A0A8S1YEZ2_PAROT|nr:unnamed protein product [Paramecium octaurelia]
MNKNAQRFKHSNNKEAIVISDEEDEPKISKKVKNDNENDCVMSVDVIPWMSKKTLMIRHPVLRLHNEIVEFYEYITPSDQEHKRRVTAYLRVEKYLQDIAPEAQIESFGSFKTRMYLPNADIDIVMIETSCTQKQLFKKVAARMMKQTNKFENVNLIANAKVPIIKFVEVESQYHFDISFNQLDGLKQIQELETAFELYPELKFLLMTLKCVLRQRDLNETYSGGVGSFLLFQMILAFLREFRKDFFQHNKEDQIKNVTLGEYMIKFLEFYGIKFDVSRKKIVMSQGGRIENKSTQDERFSLFSPQDPDHDVGHSSYKIKEIFKIFQNRHNFLTNYNFKPGESVLRYLINPTDQKFSFLKPAQF